LATGLSIIKLVNYILI